MTGWIAIDRGIFEHAFFAREPMSEREAWVWIISRAAWKDTRHRVGTEMVAVPRGSFLTTLREMQHAWLWRSDTRVRTFLRRLESDAMIVAKTNAKGNAQKTQISVCNYEVFQSIKRTENAEENAPETHGKRTKETSEPINQKKEAKASRAKASKDNVFAILSQVASPAMVEQFMGHRDGMKKPITDAMAEAMLKMLQGHPDPDAVLNSSIANGWQGIFPDKIKRTEPQNGKPTGQGRLSAFIAGASGAPRVDSWEDSNPSQPLLARR